MAEREKEVGGFLIQQDSHFREERHVSAAKQVGRKSIRLRKQQSILLICLLSLISRQRKGEEKVQKSIEGLLSQ